MQIYRVSIAVLFLGAILTPAWSADVTEAVALFDSYVKAVNEDDLPAELKLFQQDRDVISVVGDQVSVGIEAVRRARTVSQRWTALDVLTLRAYELGDSSVFLFATVEYRDPATDSVRTGTAALSLVLVETAQGWQIKHHHLSDV